MAAVPCLPDRRRGHPGNDRRRGRQPDHGGRGRPGRDAGDGHGGPQQRRDRHRPGPPARDPRQPADARREGAGCADRPRLRRSGPVADVHHRGLAVLRRCAAAPGPSGAAVAARHPQDHRASLAARVPARCHLQPRLRDQPADRSGRLGGRHHRPVGADRRAGDLRRRTRRRQRGRGGVQLPGDDRPAVHVRLLRRAAGWMSPACRSPRSTRPATSTSTPSRGGSAVRAGSRTSAPGRARSTSWAP